ncbi:uncharacterized protein [Primulina eburnea]|uniref:uncharacterized protein isoform X2 n=1 Tax=Primulina eburnea TaxID=1245227 RepID=UPI003C6CACB3
MGSEASSPAKWTLLFSLRLRFSPIPTATVPAQKRETLRATRTSRREGTDFLECGTGALAIFLHKSFQVDITTSDYDDAEIEENIAYNCQINGVTPVLPHMRHSWGDVFPISDPKWDLIIASDILLYVKQYPNLIKSLFFLLKSYKPIAVNAISSSGDDACLLPRPAFLMSWRRRIGKEDESLFFRGCEKAGLAVDHLGSRVYCITSKEITADHSA